MKDFLKEGDVIFLKNGMQVHAQIPEKFVFDNKKLSNTMRLNQVIVGKYYSMRPNITNDILKLADSIVADFDFHLGVKLKQADAALFITTNLPAITTSSFILNEGEFVVVKTAFEGGGTAMFHDTYPDGHHVFCKRLNPDGTYNDNGTEINFYQSGCFSGTILPKDLEVLRTLSKNFA